MKKLELSKEATADAVARIQAYFEDELDTEIGSIPAQFLLEFFATQIGGHYYNQGLTDALAAINRKIEDISEEVYALEVRANRF